jgi:pyroglutamyl-peptidase
MLRPLSKTAPETSGRAGGRAPSAPRPTVLLTGFDAFDGARTNPSWLVAAALHRRQIVGHRIVAAQLPTVFDRSRSELAALLKLHNPTLVVCLGLAGGRKAISLERVAINVNDARIPDNSGQQPLDTPVLAGGPAAYFTSLPVKAMLRALQQAGVAAEVSQTAGTFVCNHVFYALMHELATRRSLRGARGGFVHLPYLPGQGVPSMPQDTMVRAIGVALRCALNTPVDVALGAGAES